MSELAFFTIVACVLFIIRATSKEEIQEKQIEDFWIIEPKTTTKKQWSEGNCIDMDLYRAEIANHMYKQYGYRYCPTPRRKCSQRSNS